MRFSSPSPPRRDHSSRAERDLGHLAGVLASTGDLMLWLVILCAAAGAILGDNTAYWIGRTVGHRIVARWFTGERRKRIDWAEEQIQERGGISSHWPFIPGGRTAGDVDLRAARDGVAPVHPFDVVAGFLWAGYAGDAWLLRWACLRAAAVEGVHPRVRPSLLRSRAESSSIAG
jgi:hypothetical protein